MARKKEEKQDTAGFWLLATLVVAATVGAMVWIGGNDGAKRGSEQPDEADQEVLEVRPLIPKGKIASASWRNKAAAVAEEEIDAGTSIFDKDMDPFKDPEQAAKAEESLKRVIDRLHGLGVYVAPADDDDDE